LTPYAAPAIDSALERLKGDELKGHHQADEDRTAVNLSRFKALKQVDSPRLETLQEKHYSAN
jgi:hypothetical protein